MNELKSNAFSSFTKCYEKWVPDDGQLKAEEWTSEKQGEQFFC